jgi:hypothetical protein
MTFVASATASSSRSNDDAMSCASRRRSDNEIDAVPPPPFGLMGVAGNLCVARKTHQQTAWYSWDETLGSAWQNTILLLNAQEITEAAMESDY